MAFCEGRSEENNVCDHIDRNTFNNHYTNLRWGTQKDNCHNTSTYRNDIPKENHKNLLAREYDKKVIEEKKYYCDLCNIACSSPSKLKCHIAGFRHNLRQKAKDELKEKYNEINYQCWKNNRYSKTKNYSYI